MPKSSILAHVHEVINGELGLKKPRSYEQKKICKLISEDLKSDFNGEVLIRNIYTQVESNWDQRKYRSKKKIQKNWRWEKNCRLGPKNRSPEVILERSIVRTTKNDWVNQVPVASGLVGRADGPRAVDLVHRCDSGWYEFIELKVGSDTPLFAAMEILQYGILYLFSRKRSEDLGYTEKHEYNKESIKMLNAPGIHLKVMAPTTYYDGYNLKWLKEAINTGFDRFMAGRGYKMDFEFESFDLSCSPALIPARSPVKWKRA